MRPILASILISVLGLLFTSFQALPFRVKSSTKYFNKWLKNWVFKSVKSLPLPNLETERQLCCQRLAGEFLGVDLTAHRAIHHFSEYPQRGPLVIYMLQINYDASHDVIIISAHGFEHFLGEDFFHPFLNDEQLPDRLYCSCQVERYRYVFLKINNSATTASQPSNRKTLPTETSLFIPPGKDHQACMVFYSYSI